MIPMVTIVGRPNTGKSTLFNRLVGERKAIESEEPGTTRDRILAEVKHKGSSFFLVDTGGLEFYKKGVSSIEQDVRTQAKMAISEANLILFVVDVKNDLTKEDLEAAEYLRKNSEKNPILLIVNKCDNYLGIESLAQFYELGLGDPLPVSAINGLGVPELFKKIILSLPKWGKKNARKKEHKERPLQISLAGKPNTGKSSLINAILNKNQLIVSSVPGTTRDAVDTLVRHQNKIYNFIDTAGLRKKNKREGIEFFAGLRAINAIMRSDIVLFVIDSSLPITHQDQVIAGEIIDSGKSIILLANKWDLKEETAEEEKRRAIFISKLQRRFSFIPWVPVIFTSAITKKNLNCIFEQIEIVSAERGKRVPTNTLNIFMRKLNASHQSIGPKGRIPKIFYMTQAETSPPFFVIFINKKKNFHFSYERFLEHNLREHFGFIGTPINFVYKEKNTY